MATFFRFAYRVCEIKPENAPDDWQDRRPADGDFRPGGDLRWRRIRPDDQWYGWDSGRPPNDRTWELSGEEYDVGQKRTMSIAWSPLSQNYFVLRHDCTDPVVQSKIVETIEQRERRPDAQEEDEDIDWHRLGYRDISHLRGLPNFFRVLDHPGPAIMPFQRPARFQHLLPRNAFREDTDGQERTCHLVGDLPLLLALHAACPPAGTADLAMVVGNLFYRNNSPCFHTPMDHGWWRAPWNHYGTPNCIVQIPN